MLTQSIINIKNSNELYKLKKNTNIGYVEKYIFLEKLNSFINFIK